MGLASHNIIDFLNEQKLGYIATVSKNNLPNISRKGTIIGWDEHTLVFANIRSPDTVGASELELKS